ncbi:sterol regulatory element binding protein cleavage-activating protein, partial [Moniliophthora roreri]
SASRLHAPSIVFTFPLRLLLSQAGPTHIILLHRRFLRKVMLALFRWLLQWARTLGHRFFLRFGLHCATHQIRIILVSGIVITSLFYPALDLYSSTNQQFSSIFTAFSSLHAQQDLVN